MNADGIGDTFAGQRIDKARLSAKRRAIAVAILEREKICFESCANGKRLFVLYSIDFWPGSELWVDRHTKQRGRGVASLIRHIDTTCPSARRALEECCG
jgi:hypothetical protein